MRKARQSDSLVVSCVPGSIQTGLPATMALLPLLLFGTMAAPAADLDTIGVTLLRQVDPTLTGSGVRVGQPEATSSGSDFEVNPSAVGQPVGLFAWISSSGTATTFPNAVGTESGHANAVAANFYGTSAGAALGVSHVDNYEATYFFSSIIDAVTPPSISAVVVNQSFTFSPGAATAVEIAYDNYAARYGTLFASGVGNGGAVLPPGTCYNSLGVGIYGSSSSVGPTSNGRSKPDLVAPDVVNGGNAADSYAIPYVAGSGAILLQAANRGDGGANTAAAGNLRTLRALLLNGAIKPTDWTNGPATPLDARYGAGVVNIFNSWHQLMGRQHSFIETTSNNSGAPHPPGNAPGNEPVLTGWDFNSISNTLSGLNYKESVNHYYFLLPGSGNYTLTATLAWNRQQNQTAINDLNLFLYNVANSNLVLCSTSAVDNVEHLFVAVLPPGRYDLQVQKNPTGQVSVAETHALAFEFFNLALNVSGSGNNIVLSWPIAPSGFRLFSTTSLTPPAFWSPVNVPVTVSNGSNYVSVPVGGPAQFFRLERP
jgi:hypothetical protein